MIRRTSLALLLLLLPSCATDARDDAADTGFWSGTAPGTTTSDPLPTTTGAATTSESTDGSSSGPGTTGGPTKFDLADTPDVPPPVEDCLECSIILDSKESGTLIPIGMTSLIGTVELENQVIYGLGAADGGRVIFSADSNVLYGEGGDCPLWEWLGASGNGLPRVLTVGALACKDSNPGQHALPPPFPSHDYASGHLPDQYVGDPSALKADWDVVVFCEAPDWEGSDLSAEEIQTLIDYTQIENGGLYLISEFFGYLAPSDVDSVNQIATALGVEFLATDLEWGGAQGAVEFDCFPAPAG